MTKHSGVKGKTVPALSRVIRADGRKVMRAHRTPEKQLKELDLRPGEARRERLRLGYMILASEAGNVAPEPNERAKKTARTRRRAQRKQPTTTTRSENQK